MLIFACLAVVTVIMTIAGILVLTSGPFITRTAPECATCGYDLRAHLHAGRCPECGHVLGPGAIRIYRPSRASAFLLTIGWLLMIVPTVIWIGIVLLLLLEMTTK